MNTKSDRGQTPSDNAKWQVALVAGSGTSAEYLLIDVRSGYFLTATGKLRGSDMSVFASYADS